MSTIFRTVLIGGAIALCGGFVSATAAHGAAGTNPSGTALITFEGRASDGTGVRITERLTDLALSQNSPIGQGVAAGPGNAFLSFYAPGGTSDGTRPAFDGISGVANSEVHLVLANHAVVPAQQPGTDLGSLLLGTYAFLVPSDTKAVTLEVGPGSYGAAEYSNGPSGGGSLTTINFEPAKTPLVIPAPVITTPSKPTSPTTTMPAPLKKAKSAKVRRSTGSGIGFTSPLDVGAGAGGAGIVLVVILIPIWRRRAYRKADAEGRVIIDSPPIALGPRIPVAIAAASDDRDNAHDHAKASDVVSPPEAQAVTVKVLGPVEIDGLAGPVKLGPVRDLLVFLALHPGRSFTSSELRSAIWVERADEPKPETLRNYLTYLRRSLPPGTLVRNGYRYSLAETMSSDWGKFCSLLVGDDERAERLAEALSLVRGAPFDGPSSGRAAPYGWADELRHRIEAAVEKAAHEFVAICLESGDVLAADTGVAQALKCVPASIIVREDHIKLGSAIGGRAELTRRIRTARAPLGSDIALLEPLARQLGWEES